MSAPEDPDPLILSITNAAVVADGNDNSSTTENAMEQTLGGKTYTVDTSQLAIRRAERNKMPFWKRFVHASALLLATPALVPAAALHVVSMYIGPSWYRNKMAYTMIR
jgi:hypothetical protein